LSDDRTQLIEILLDVANDVAKNTIGALQEVFGYECEIYYPQARATTPEQPIPDMFKTDGQAFDYSVAPNEKGEFIVIGLLNDQFSISDQTFDQFAEDTPYVLTHGEKQLPNNSKVKVFIGGHHFNYRVITYKVFPSHDGFVYIKNMIAPFN